MPAALLCRYRYDPLDQLIGHTLTAQPLTQRFYHKDRVSTEIHGDRQRSVFQYAGHVLAERDSPTASATLLGTDRQRSTLLARTGAVLHQKAYTAHGYCPGIPNAHCLLGFNGERPDPVTGHYLLGNGYRAFNPVLLRFNSPDSWSPFGKGGLNPYAYCAGDPINRRDPSGHMNADDHLALTFSAFGLLSAVIGLPGLIKIFKKIKNRKFTTTDIPDLITPVAGVVGASLGITKVGLGSKADHNTSDALMIGAGILSGLSLIANAAKALLKAKKAVKRWRHPGLYTPDHELAIQLAGLPPERAKETINLANEIRGRNSVLPPEDSIRLTHYDQQETPV